MSRCCWYVLLVLALSGTAGGAEPCAWPLDLDTRYLTGNFMEPRDGRFHSGLDLKTNSRTGYAVVAVSDGWISRIKLAEGGYGKALYLRGDDGLTYVYGHLGRLADHLRAHVRDHQRRTGAYSLDLDFPAGRWPVRCGDVLALSGQSGTNGPHLHFEVRDGDGRLLDPQTQGFAVADTLAPEILAVRAVPTVGDAPTPTLVWGDGAEPLAGRLPDLFLADGRVRFSTRLVERSDRLRYRLGPWRVGLWLDGREVFTSRNDQLTWDRNRQQRLEYMRTPLGWERWLRCDERVTLDGRHAAPGWGEQPLAAGRHRLRLVAEDRAGNRSEVTWVVEVDPGLPADAHPGWQTDGHHHPEPWLITDEAVDGAGVCQTLGPPLHWRRGGVSESVASRRLRLAGLEMVAGPVEFRAPELPLLKPWKVAWPQVGPEVPLDTDDPALAVYRLDDGDWSHEGPLRRGAAGAVFTLDKTGVYAVLRDKAAPVIATAPLARDLEEQPGRSRHGVTLPRWPQVRLPVGDHGSGIDWSSLAVRLNGDPLVAEPDAPRDRILVELPDRLPPGRHVLEVMVTDRAGHRARKELVLDLQRAASP